MPRNSHVVRLTAGIALVAALAVPAQAQIQSMVPQALSAFSQIPTIPAPPASGTLPTSGATPGPQATTSVQPAETAARREEWRRRLLRFLYLAEQGNGLPAGMQPASGEPSGLRLGGTQSRRAGDGDDNATPSATGSTGTVTSSAFGPILKLVPPATAGNATRSGNTSTATAGTAAGNVTSSAFGPILRLGPALGTQTGSVGGSSAMPTGVPALHGVQGNGRTHQTHTSTTGGAAGSGHTGAASVPHTTGSATRHSGATTTAAPPTHGTAGQSHSGAVRPKR